MIKDIFIFRHGQTDNNLNRICQGCMINSPLNKTGIAQAEELGRKLAASVKLEAIYTSPLQRAYQTAAIVKSYYPDISVHILSEICEGNFGDAEGKALDEIEQQYPGILADFLEPTHTTWNIRFPGAQSESKQQIFQRAMQGLYIIANDPKNVIGISCHAGVISALACGLHLKNINNQNCAVIHLQYETLTGHISQAE